MNTKKRVSWQAQIAANRKQLEVLAQKGVPLTDPRVQTLSQEIDRLILLLKRSTEPSLKDPSSDDSPR